MDDLDAVAERLNGLTDDERDRLGARIVVLAVGFIDPSTGAGPGQEAAETAPRSAEPRRVSLDAGFQLSFDSTRPSLPLTPDRAAEWAEGGLPHSHTNRPCYTRRGARKPHHRSAHTRRCHACDSCHRRQGRRTHHAKPTKQPMHQVRRRSWPTTRLQEVLRVLESQVAAEEAGTATTTLAGVALSAATGGTPTDEEEVLLRAIAILHFARFDLQEGLEP